ncbi:hypothetical protein EV715DRAFT_272146 [Schizophyllum commune]
MADCFRSCGRPSVGKSTTHTLNKDTTGTSHRLILSESILVIRAVGGSALAFVSLHAHCLISRSADWSTVVGSISRQTLRRPRRTAMTPIALIPSFTVKISWCEL